MKSAAAADPEGFARELAAGNIGADENGDFVNLARNGESAEKSGSNGKSSGFGRVPAPQNVVRMPPINWSKYQIVGEPLDKIHEEERRRPSSGEPRREDSTHRPPEHVLASPYRPLVDRLDTPAKRDDSTSSRGKKT